MSYLSWLIAVSLLFVLLERLHPARRRQDAVRPQLANDLSYLLLYGYGYALITASPVAWIATHTREGLAALSLTPEAGWLDERPLAVQVLVLFLVGDFLQWCVHRLLHRVPFLWQFHKVHHSIRTMDWAGNFRFHWMELVVYRSLLFVPIFCWLGGSGAALFLVAVGVTAWGHFNHSNVDVDLGRLGYVFNSPRMHLWHHDASGEGRGAKNFAIALSLWDYLFGTAYWPRERPPARLGYPGDEEMPRDLPRQLLFPLTRRRAG